MNTLMLFLGLVVIASWVEGKHIHPRSLVHAEEVEETTNGEKLEDVDGMSIDAIRKFRPNRFVPINSVFYFKTYPPCQEGFERDIFGVCREVWD